MSRPQRHRWPAVVDEDYRPVQKHPLQSLVTTLPVLMLILGLYVFYKAEHAETAGAALYDQTRVLEGEYSGLSQIPSGGSGRHHLWFVTGERQRGPRITPAQATRLQQLEVGVRIRVHMAPHVDGSSTWWAWRVEAGERVIYDERHSARVSAFPAAAGTPGSE